MTTELDFSNGFDPQNMDDRPAVGKAHILIHNVDETGDRSIVIDYEVLAHEAENQEGKTGREFLSKSPKAVKRMVKFALATKLTTLDDLVQAKTNGRNPSINFAQAEGRQICVDLVKSGDYINWSFEGMYAVDSDDASGYPKNDGMARKAADAAVTEDELADVFN